MDITTLLASIWGPVILAVGVGVFVSRDFYIKIYRDLEKDVLAVLLFGMTMMAAGIVHVTFHSMWDTFNQGLVSFLGWGLLAKGTLFVVGPGIVDRMGNNWVRLKLVPFVGVTTILAGGYLTWLGFFA